ncbi:GNAT family N-acetyltransferase [Actinoplanes sp. NBRC 103695]|uniref:GNAT family N-acetyltransferase n=1 Tax=Actinoplanes sp. NBRC 103695 TaxID=3032202 RepID=UPI0024A0A926|nr:GNAT family N-acetyltransferase [Actinoplanes sp. NBRC 103695]GLZ02077.1 N-acetyltransferase [Actinoplanes sp. NBRC 103695]
MRTVRGREVLTDVDHLAGVYAEAFGTEPWNEGPDDVAAFRRRLADDMAEPDFRAVIADDGFATAWRTTLPLPTTRAYPRVVDHLGPDRVNDLLAGALVVDELAVRPSAQGTGLGVRLLTALIGEDHAWLLTSARAPGAVAFYRRAGWQQVPPRPGVDSTLVLFVSPGRNHSR